MERRRAFIAAGMFFLVATVAGVLFSYTGLDNADKWSSIISMLLSFASLLLAVESFRQSRVEPGEPPPAKLSTATPLATTPAPAPKYSVKTYSTENQYIGDGPSTVGNSFTTEASAAAESPKYSIISDHTKHQFIGDDQVHNPTINKVEKVSYKPGKAQSVDDELYR